MMAEKKVITETDRLILRRYCKEDLQDLYEYLSDEEAEQNYKCLTENKGCHPTGKVCVWESAGQMEKRVMSVLERYRNYSSVIVVCHGILMQYVLGIDHPQHGQIAKCIYKKDGMITSRL